ncbi:MAG: hypothetical protein R3E79_53895 [Caldilineaceae bacterium]
MGYAAALAWVLFLIIMVMTGIQFLLARRWVYYEGSDRTMSVSLTRTPLLRLLGGQRRVNAPAQDTGEGSSSLWRPQSVVHSLPATVILDDLNQPQTDGSEMVIPPQWIPNPTVWSNYIDVFGYGCR